MGGEGVMGEYANILCHSCNTTGFRPDLWTSRLCRGCDRRVDEVNELVALLRALVSRKDSRRVGKVFGRCVVTANGGGCACSGDCLRPMTMVEMRDAVEMLTQGRVG